MENQVFVGPEWRRRKGSAECGWRERDSSLRVNHHRQQRKRQERNERPADGLLARADAGSGLESAAVRATESEAN